MGNRRKNHKSNLNIQHHKKAVHRKIEAENEMTQLGLTLQSNFIAIGVIFEYLTISQMTYLGIISINKFCHERIGADLCIFYQHYSLPPVKLLCPILGIQQLEKWHHPTITTSIETCLEALDFNIPRVFFYVFDPDFINRPDLSSNDLRRAFCDPRVHIITRHKDHKELVETEFGIQVLDIIPDFNIEAFIKLIVTETEYN